MWSIARTRADKHRLGDEDRELVKSPSPESRDVIAPSRAALPSLE